MVAGQKFYVYGGGRWREIDTFTGRIAGWGAVHFVSVRRGRLQLARKNSVLSGLRALACGRPTSVHDGPQLSQIRCDKSKGIEKAQQALSEPKSHNHQHCCQHNCHCNADAIFNSILKPITSTVAVQCTISSPSRLFQPTVTNNSNSKTILNTNNNINYNKEKEKRSAKRNRISSDESDVSSTKVTHKKNKTNDQLTSLPQKKSQRPEPCKELLITEEDILLIRSFIEHDDENVFDVDLEKFDSDDFYKCLVFYKLNPLVNVERSKKIADMLQRKSSITSSVSLRDFIKNLGLQRVEEASQSSNKYRIRRRKPVQNHSSDSDFDKENMKKSVISTKVKQHNGLLGKKYKRVVKRDPVTGQFKSANTLLREMRSKQQVNESVKTNHSLKANNRSKVNESIKKNESVKVNEKVKLNNSVKINDKANVNDKAKVNDKIKVNDKVKVNDEVKLNNSVKINDKANVNDKAKVNDKIKVNDKVKVSDEVKVNDKRKVNVNESVKGKETVQVNDTVEVSSSGSENRRELRERVKRPRLAVVAAKRLYSTGNAPRREYTKAEDVALVQWVLGAGRARYVNGNQIWRELQPIHHKKTGHFRSWHSLRNRYLRYLLPTLGNLEIPADEAARLRAAAAAGHLKWRKQTLLVKEKRVISAWSRRPRSFPRESPTPTKNLSSPNPSKSSRVSTANQSPSSPNPSKSSRDSTTNQSQSSPNPSKSSHDTDYSSYLNESLPKNLNTGSRGAKVTRTLRSSAVGTSPTRTHKRVNDTHTPTYSELTRRYASKYSTPDSDTSNFSYISKDKTNRQTRLSLRRKTNDRKENDGSDDFQQRKSLRSDTQKSKNDTSLNSDRQAKRLRPSKNSDTTDRHDSQTDTSDTERPTKKLRTIRINTSDRQVTKADKSDRPRTRRLYNPNAF